MINGQTFDAVEDVGADWVLEVEREYETWPEAITDLEAEQALEGWRGVRGEPVTEADLRGPHGKLVLQLIEAFMNMGMSERAAVMAGTNGGMEQLPPWVRAVR